MRMKIKMQRKIIGATALAIALAQTGPCLAAGAIALGLPPDVATQGIAIFVMVDSATMEIAKEKALARCKALPHASDTSKALCKIVATFRNQCATGAIDPQDGTPGFGWAIADNSAQARSQALSNCRDTAGPTRQDACVVDQVWCDGSAK
jgi:hypothetical protein